MVTSRRHQLGAHVPAMAALWLWRRVESDMQESAQRFERIGQPAVARALRFAAAELESAAAGAQAATLFGVPPAEPAEPAGAELVSVSGRMRELTVAQAADRMRCSAGYVRRLCRDEALECRKVGSSWLINAASVDDFTETRRTA